jgi:signal peptidase I
MIEMNDQIEDKKAGKLQKRLNVALTILLALAVVVCLYVVIQVLSYGYANLGGFMMFRVVTGSMEPTIPTGALMIARETNIESIQLNDIICFRTQLSEIWGKIVTHRVVGVMQTEVGGILLETKGDANLVSDIYFVDETNFVGKVIWYSGDDSILANIMSLFTNKIGFLGCIVFPTLFIAGIILKDSVASIRKEMLLALEESQRIEQGQSWEDDPLCGMTQEEYNEMYERIRAELMEELMQIYGEILREQKTGSEGSETT